MGRRGRRQRRRIGVRGPLGLVRLPGPAHRPSRALGWWHREPVAPAGPGVLQPVGSEASRALHLRVEPEAHRPLPETRFLAGQPHGRGREADRRECQWPDTRSHRRRRRTARPRCSTRFASSRTPSSPVSTSSARSSLRPTQGIGDTLVVPGDDELDGVAVCHCGAGSEAGSDTCYVKFAAVRPGAGAADRFERLLDACEAFAADSALERLVAGVNTGRLDAYRRLLSRGFRHRADRTSRCTSGPANRISTHPSTTSSTISASPWDPPVCKQIHAPGRIRTSDPRIGSPPIRFST